MTTAEQQMTPENVVELLIEQCGMRSSNTEDVVAFLNELDTESPGCPEFRIGGALGSGGKLYSNGETVFVGCYAEDTTEELRALIERVNDRLKAFPVEKDARDARYHQWSV
jgi:hypothetical protein